VAWLAERRQVAAAAKQASRRRVAEDAERAVRVAAEVALAARTEEEDAANLHAARAEAEAALVARTEAEEAAILHAARAEAEAALAARTEAEVREAGWSMLARGVEPEYELVAELLRRLELVEYLPLCLENELEDGASYFGTRLERALLCD
jgi:hypothetical protein